MPLQVLTLDAYDCKYEWTVRTFVPKGFMQNRGLAALLPQAILEEPQ